LRNRFYTIEHGHVKPCVDGGGIVPTIKDIARETGVSTSTVSHVINGTRHVSDDLRDRIEAAMRELDYRPNALARSLRRGRTEAVGLLVPDNANPFFAEIARTIEDRGFASGHSVILCNTDGRSDKERTYVDVLIGKQVDGIIILAAGVEDAAYLAEVARRGTPLVIVDRELPDLAADTILVANEEGGRAATEHLISLGHRDIACIAGPSGLSTARERRAGYLAAMRTAGIQVHQPWIVEAPFQLRGGADAMGRLLSASAGPEGRVPTAVFACNDLIAIGAIRAAREAGLSVPDQLSVVGFDDISLAEMVDPPLTTVRQPVSEIARLAIEHLLGWMESSETTRDPVRTVLPTELVVRATTAPHAAP
jgi:LacI family transcriptional regulator